MRWLEYAWTGLLGILARQRSIALAVLSALTAIPMAFVSQTQAHWSWWVVFAGLLFLMVLAGTVPARYAAEPMLAYMLPTIHKLLELAPSDRVTVHHLKSASNQTYEQLTEYHPPPDRPSRGRTFTFSHGIVGQCFKTIHPLSWAVPAGKGFDEAMVDRWSFSQDELGRLTRDRRSFMVYPLGQDGPFARAVLYFDSASPERFCESNGSEHRKRIQEYFQPQLTEALRRS